MSLGGALRRRVSLLASLLVGCSAGWFVPDLWPELAGLNWSPADGAEVLLVGVDSLTRIEAGEAPATATTGVAEALERALDDHLAAFQRPLTGSGWEIPPEASAGATALVAAYREVFPTVRRGSEPVLPELLAAPRPSPEHLRLAGPALRSAIGPRREELAALWLALRGEGPVPEVELSPAPDVLVLRFDAHGVRGRLRLYGDGRVVATGPGPEPPEVEQRLHRDGMLRLVMPLVEGGVLATDAVEAWRAAGASGCRVLSTQRRGTHESLSIFPRPDLAVTLHLAGLRERVHGAAMPAIVREARFPAAFVDARCRPESPVARRLQAAVAALAATVDDMEAADGGTARVPTLASSDRGREMPGLAVVYTGGARGAGIWITDGRLTGRLVAGHVSRFWASPDGRFVVYATQDGLMRFDRSSAGRSERLAAPDWRAFSALWSPQSDALLLAGRPRIGWGEVLLAGPDGSSPRPLTSLELGFPVAWSTDGRLVYLQAPHSEGLRALTRDGRETPVEHPMLQASFRGELSPSPDGRYLAFHATTFAPGEPRSGLFTLPLTPTVALPAPQERAIQLTSRLASFSWAPDGRSIVFAEGRALREASPDGSGGRTLIADNFGECGPSQPRVSPDGRWLLFLRCASSMPQPAGYIFVASRNGSDPVLVGYGGGARWVRGTVEPSQAADPPAPPGARATGRVQRW